MAATFQAVYLGQTTGSSITISNVVIGSGQALALCYISRWGTESGFTTRTHNGNSLGSPNYSGTPVLAAGLYTFAEVFHSPTAGTGDIVVALDSGTVDAALYAVVYSNQDTSTPALDFDVIEHDFDPANQESLSSSSSSNALLVTFARARAVLTSSMAASTMTVRSAAAQTANDNTIMLATKAGTGATDSTRIEFDGAAFPSLVMATLSLNGVAGGSSTTVAPTQGTVTVSGRQPAVNPFTNVRIHEVLVNSAGSPVANKTGIHLLVWYDGVPAGAPDLSYSNMTTDANGSTSWSIATGDLVYNQHIFGIAHDGGASLSTYTCFRLIPTYSG